MNAIGIPPNIAGSVPKFPYILDMLESPLRLDLKSFSYELIEELFMQIETPEDPVDFPEALETTAPEPPKTIGLFYKNIIEIIKNETIPDLFKNAERDAYKQIKIDPNFRKFAYLNNEERHNYPLKDEIDFIIKDINTAVRHLTWVVEEGEGASPYNPLDAEGIPGHYYRFESILKSRYLVRDDTVEPEKHSYSGADLIFTREGVHEFDDNAEVENYSDQFEVELFMNDFNEKYTKVINLLQTAFNCSRPEDEEQAKQAYSNSLNQMQRMQGTASNIIDAAKSAGIKAGIPFQYGGPEGVS